MRELERDRSRADFMWCKWAVERGWSVEETAARLAEVSGKAQERIRLKDEGYTLVTARNAAAAVDRERGRRPATNSLSPLDPTRGRGNTGGGLFSRGVLSGLFV